MGKLIDLAEYVARKGNMKALEKVLQKDIAKEAKWGSVNPGIETGPLKKTRHELSFVAEQDPDSDLISMLFSKDRLRGGKSPSAEGIEFGRFDSELKPLNPTSKSLERVLAKLRNKPNVFFADGTEI